MAIAIHHPSRHGKHGKLNVRQSTDWRAAVWAGLIAGLVFLVAEMLLVALVMGQSPWGPPRMMAAMLFGTSEPPPSGFSARVLAPAMFVHLPLSAAYGVIIGGLVHRVEMGRALLIGAVFGLVAVYGVNFYLIAPFAFPWFIEARNGISALMHILFGVVAAAAYVWLRKPR